MSDGMLSQEEIEALLRGETLENRVDELEKASEMNAEDNTNDDINENANENNDDINNEVSQIEDDTEALKVEDYLSPMEQDALGEVGNISFGSSATALSSLLGQKVEITTPIVSIINSHKLEKEFPHPYVAVQVQYTAGLSGLNLLVIKQSDAAIIADLMLGGDGLNPNQDLGEIQLSAIQEAMNQMMGSAATSMSTVFNQKVDISPPSIDLMNISENEGKDNIPTDDILVKISFRLKIGDLIDSNIMQLLPLDFGKEVAQNLLGGAQTIGSNAAPEQPVQPQPQVQQAPPMQPAQPTIAPEPAIPNMQAQQQMAATAYQEAPYAQQVPPAQSYQQPVQPVNVQQAQFVSFENSPITKEESRNLNMLLDIPLQVTVELGRTTHSVKDILQLSSGSIIELDKLAGEPVDILVNNRLIAKGEVVVIEENFGVRITNIISKEERLNNLR